MKNRLFTMMLAAVPVFALAAKGDTVADTYFGSQTLQLTPHEKAAISIAQKWQAGGSTGGAGAGLAGIQPVAGNEGFIRFVFGVQRPSLVCAVLQACDVELQPGEQVNNLNVGDSRFLIEPAISGTGAAEVQHLIIKPLDVGLETSLVVTTNRRTYHFRLRSHRTEYMPRVGFIYNEDALAKWDAIKSKEVKQKQDRTIPQTGEYLGDLSFAYDVVGSAPWKPVRVYNNGTKTIIQMPPAMAQTDAPTLLVIQKEGGLFGDDETSMVNYRVQGDRYIVDAIFAKAVLISGVGASQDRVVITNTNNLALSMDSALVKAPKQEPLIVEPATAQAQIPPVTEQLTWEILETDGTLQKTLARWSRAARWDVEWKNVPEIKNTGYVRLGDRDFLSAAEYVLDKAKAAAKAVGMDISVTAYSNNVLVISKEEHQ